MEQVRELISSVVRSSKRPRPGSVNELLIDYSEILRVAGLFDVVGSADVELTCNHLLVLINDGRDDVEEMRVCLDRLVRELEVLVVKRTCMVPVEVRNTGDVGVVLSEFNAMFGNLS